MVERRAYAKINLFLDIESRRTDGYHNIKSVMQTVDWFDVINISLAATDGIHITSNNKNVPTDSSNIVFRACKAFFARLGYSEGVNIHIEKNIPMSAGMAGGSADGAATLEGLNELLDSPFSTETLIDIGKDVGADIPFCIVGGTKIISGIGEIIENCTPMPECYIVCAKQNDSGVSTPQAYKQLDEKYEGFYNRDYDKEKLDEMISAIKNSDVNRICNATYNIFEEVISKDHSSVNRIKQVMNSSGAITALMSGSGPSVFGIFTDKTSAQKACDKLISMGAVTKVCQPITK